MKRLIPLIGVTLLLAPATPAAASAGQPSGLATALDRAAHAYGVPRDLLAAVGFSETRLVDHAGRPSQDNGYGVMHLAANPDNQSLTKAAARTGIGEARLKTDVAANVRGAAAVLRAYADDAGLSRRDRDRIAAWYPAVAAFAGTHSDTTARVAADHVYDLLRQGFTAADVTVTGRAVQPELGRYADVAPAGRLSTGQAQQATALAAAVPQYPPAHWVPASTSNYSAGRSSAITTIVIHVTQGSYAGTINWFQNPAAQVSAHYVVRSSDGDITQMVREEDTAWHVRNSNPYSLGIEHEGYVDDPGWFTDSMYRASAGLTRYLADKWGLPKNRTAIKGHNEMPGNDHTDPGPYWNWDYYMSLVNAGGKLL
ncbi:MAG: N-acetylmuramoyl-L-alanine amidase, partial [Hamadaea sp.]|nr:N-acetylmuramoyl-L-alanine amidase [Hamadaea sp.]